MTSIENKFSVPFDFPVHFARGVFDAGDSLLADVFARLEPERRHRVAVVLDSGLVAANPGLQAEIMRYFVAHSGCLELAGDSGPIVVPGGPPAKKGLGALGELIEKLSALRLDRQSFVMAIGGGSMLDMAGLAAGLIHRGLRLVRMPTTVLGQCDAGIGVKNGVDAYGQKNFIGQFAPPFAVVNDYLLLESLPDVHWVGGVSEACKVALIRNAAFFDFLAESAAKLANRDLDTMAHLVYECARIHLEQITGGGDPFEMGSARPLDFGHWAAHRIEIMSEHRISHGWAVSVGMAVDCGYAVRLGLMSQDEYVRVLDFLDAVGLPTFAPELAIRDSAGNLAVLRGIEEFREHLGGQLTVTLPDGIGRGMEIHSLNTDWVEDCIDELGRRGLSSVARAGRES